MINADRHPRIIGQFGIHRVEQRIDALGSGPTKICVLIERCSRGDPSGVIALTCHCGQQLSGLGQDRIETIGRHAHNPLNGKRIQFQLNAVKLRFIDRGVIRMAHENGDIGIARIQCGGCRLNERRYIRHAIIVQDQSIGGQGLQFVPNRRQNIQKGNGLIAAYFCGVATGVRCGHTPSANEGNAAFQGGIVTRTQLHGIVVRKRHTHRRVGIASIGDNHLRLTGISTPIAIGIQGHLDIFRTSQEDSGGCLIQHRNGLCARGTGAVATIIQSFYRKGPYNHPLAFAISG